MILTQSQFILTDGFWGYLSNLSLISRSLTRNLDLRDSSASKKYYKVTKQTKEYWQRTKWVVLSGDGGSCSLIWAGAKCDCKKVIFRFADKMQKISLCDLSPSHNKKIVFHWIRCCLLHCYKQVPKGTKQYQKVPTSTKITTKYRKERKNVGNEPGGQQSYLVMVG